MPPWDHERIWPPRSKASDAARRTQSRARAIAEGRRSETAEGTRGAGEGRKGGRGGGVAGGGRRAAEANITKASVAAKQPPKPSTRPAVKKRHGKQEMSIRELLDAETMRPVPSCCSMSGWRAARLLFRRKSWPCGSAHNRTRTRRSSCLCCVPRATRTCWKDTSRTRKKEA